MKKHSKKAANMASERFSARSTPPSAVAPPLPPKRMKWPNDSTTRADMVAAEMRAYYELHREGWWQHSKGDWTIVADHLMLGLLTIATRCINEAIEERR